MWKRTLFITKLSMGYLGEYSMQKTENLRSNINNGPVQHAGCRCFSTVADHCVACPNTERNHLVLSKRKNNLNKRETESEIKNVTKMVSARKSDSL